MLLSTDPAALSKGSTLARHTSDSTEGEKYRHWAVVNGRLMSGLYIYMVNYGYIYILMGIHLQMVYLSPNLAELLSHGLVKHDTSASSIRVFSRSNEDLDAVRD